MSDTDFYFWLAGVIDTADSKIEYVDGKPQISVISDKPDVLLHGICERTGLGHFQSYFSRDMLPYYSSDTDLEKFRPYMNSSRYYYIWSVSGRDAISVCVGVYKYLIDKNLRGSAERMIADAYPEFVHLIERAR